jgi:hypothetical protein
MRSINGFNAEGIRLEEWLYFHDFPDGRMGAGAKLVQRHLAFPQQFLIPHESSVRLQRTEHRSEVVQPLTLELDRELGFLLD